MKPLIYLLVGAAIFADPSIAEDRLSKNDKFIEVSVSSVNSESDAALQKRRSEGARFTWAGMEAIANGGATVRVFPSGNVGLIVSAEAPSPFGSSGGIAFYSNGDGTYNTITYPPS